MIGLIIAMEKEAEVFVERAGAFSIFGGKKFFSFDAEGVEVVMAICGPGKVNAGYTAALLLERYRPGVLVNCGTAGNLADGKSGDIAVGEKCVQCDVDTSALGDEPGYVSGVGRIYFPTWEEAGREFAARIGARYGVFASGDGFLDSEKRKAEIRSRFGAVSYDMESGAAAHCAFMADTKFLVYKCISDSADGTAGANFSIFLPEASQKLFDAFEILLKIIKRRGDKK